MRHLTIRLALLAIALLCLAPAHAGAQRERRLPDVLAAADAAWKAGNHAEALAGYEEVVRRDSTSARALFRLATLLAWRNELDRAVVLLRKYCLLAPTDDDGRAALARTVAWSGRYDESIAMYDSLLARNAGQRDAALGAAQALAWSGRFDGAIARYEQWLRTHPADADAWTALAQTWSWSGRPNAAREALQRALTAQPTHRDALAQLRSVEAVLASSVEPTITTASDNDRNRATTYGLRAGVAAPWSAPLLVDGSLRVAELAPRRGTAVTVRASTGWTLPGGKWTVGGALGVTGLEGHAAPGTSATRRTEPLISLRATGRVTPRLSLGGGVSHAPFDETAALILARIATTSVAGGADVTLRPRLTLSGEGGTTRLVGGSAPNTRSEASATLRWAVRPAVSLASSVRSFGYQHAAADGYFAPKQYVLAEGSARVRLGGDLGWGVESELGLGHQTIAAFDGTHAGRFAQRVNASAAYRPLPGVEWSLGGTFANVASPATVSSGEYRAWTVSLRGRLRL